MVQTILVLDIFYLIVGVPTLVGNLCPREAIPMHLIGTSPTLLRKRRPKKATVP